MWTTISVTNTIRKEANERDRDAIFTGSVDDCIGSTSAETTYRKLRRLYPDSGREIVTYSLLGDRFKIGDHIIPVGLFWKSGEWHSGEGDQFHGAFQKPVERFFTPDDT